MDGNDAMTREASDDSVLSRVRRALGRTAPPGAPPEPPDIDEPITRLVHTDFGLPELFARRAADQKIGVPTCYAEALSDELIGFLRAQ